MNVKAAQKRFDNILTSIIGLNIKIFTNAAIKLNTLFIGIVI